MTKKIFLNETSEKNELQNVSLLNFLFIPRIVFTEKN